MSNTIGKGGAAFVTQMQKMIREQKLPETCKKFEALPVELKEAIRKRAGVPDVALREMNNAQRYAMRRAAEDIFMQVERKASQAGTAFRLLVTACTTELKG